MRTYIGESRKLANHYLLNQWTAIIQKRINCGTGLMFGARKLTMEEARSAKNIDIPIMQEKIEEEEEILYYPLKTYLISITIFFLLGLTFVLCLVSGLLSNKFGGRLDATKLLAASLILLSIASYFMKLLWSKKNRITKMVTKHHYIDPREFIVQDRVERKRRDDVKKSEEEKRSGEEKRRVERRRSDEEERREEVKRGEDRKQIEDKISFIELREEANHENPTCVLNAFDSEYSLQPPFEESQKEEEVILVLTSQSHSEYQDIMLLSSPILVGKSKDNVDYFLENEAISRYHAKIIKEEKQIFIMDLNSTNGSFLNGRALMPYQKEELLFEDEIAFANVRYRLEKRIQP